MWAAMAVGNGMQLIFVLRLVTVVSGRYNGRSSIRLGGLHICALSPIAVGANFG
jgi:hypothetical protein